MNQWFVYVVKCADNSYYCGITTDVDRRVREHNGKKAAKYTRSRQPVTLKMKWPAKNKSHALRKEASFKKLSRLQKTAVMNDKSWIDGK